MKRACEFCSFWLVDNPSNRGECHRFPPQVNGNVTAWPETNKTEWCFEFIPPTDLVEAFEKIP